MAKSLLKDLMIDLGLGVAEIAGIRGAETILPEKYDFDEEHYEKKKSRSSNSREPTKAYAYSPDAAKTGRDRNIRLLELLPGRPSDDIRCVLTTHPLLPGVVKYEALSYVWGDPAITKPISVNGDRLDVTVNLRSALRHLRRTNKSRILWVDAICIDQSDPDERAYQVSFMGDIYRSAKRVIIWLGLSDHHTKNIFALLGALEEEAAQAKMSPIEPDTNEATGKVKMRVKQGSEIYDLLGNGWFQRSWTVQEILSARDALVVCGWESISWDIFSDAIMYVSEQEKMAPLIQHFGPHRRDFDELYSLQKASEFLREPHEAHRQLLELLTRFCGRYATDKRDKIYAFLGLVTNAEELGITTDYRISVEELYKNVATELITQSRSLALLRFLPLNDDGSDRDESSLPSWAPSWGEIYENPLPFHDDHEESSKTTSPDTSHSSDIQISDDRTTLTVSGYAYDEITKLTEYLPSAMDDDDDSPEVESDSDSGLWEATREFINEIYKLMAPLEILVQWEAFAGLPKQAADEDKTKKALVDRYWQTLCAGALLPEGKAETESAFWKWYHTMDSVRNKKRGWYKHSSSITNLMALLRHVRAIWSGFARFERLLGVAFYRRLAKTKAGRLALVPRTTCVGDSIMQCMVSDFPLVIRKMHNQETWKFVGPAYVHGGTVDSSLCRPMRFK
ncbi:heterokaryon incompatibility protein-domain-containing protein [Nemania sp. FL0031]|nr:heterokaryon incompatibility protein-domain-containing protein [Nemania sp. FL0031]